MRTMLLATAAVLSLGIGAAKADRAPSGQQVQMATRVAPTWGNAALQFAAGGGNHPQSSTDEHGTQYAAAIPGSPHHLVLLAQGWHPGAETNAEFLITASKRSGRGRQPRARSGLPRPARASAGPKRCNASADAGRR